MPKNLKESPVKAVEPLKKISSETQAAPASKKSRSAPELLRGFRDILPEDQPSWDRLRDVLRGLASAYSFPRIELPLLERADLFVRTVGKETDIVEKEMYVFEEPGGDRVALRPEATASVARAYITHGMVSLPQPVKLCYEGPMFRHERPQAGRYRQFHQFGFESIGSLDPIVDAQMILLATRVYRELGLDVTVQINSLGTVPERKGYIAELTKYLRGYRKELSEDDQRRLQKNPLRVLDSKEPAMAEILQHAPQIVDWLEEESKQHFMQVLEYLDACGVSYQLRPTLVRGLDYYTRTVFEVWESGDEGARSQNALCAGGRYDGLIGMLGGREDTPACGFAVGMERAIAAMRDKGVAPAPAVPDVFFAQLGDAARKQGLTIFEDLRQAGLFTVEAFGKGGLKPQLEMANKLGVGFTLILGQKEVMDGTIIVRDMETGSQEIIDCAKLRTFLGKKVDARREKLSPKAS